VIAASLAHPIARPESLIASARLSPPARHPHHAAAHGSLTTIYRLWGTTLATAFVPGEIVIAACCAEPIARLESLIVSARHPHHATTHHAAAHGSLATIYRLLSTTLAATFVPGEVVVPA